MRTILSLILWDLFLNLTDSYIIVLMISSTSAIGAYSGKKFKYRYVVPLSAMCGIAVTLWAYVFLPVPTDAKTPLVGIYVFTIRFLSALFWGSATWVVLRYFNKWKLARHILNKDDRI